MKTENRYGRVLKLVKDKEVLDIGCTWIDDDGMWLHGKLVEIAKSVIGLDIDGVTELVARGFDIIDQSAEKPYNLHRKFDVITAIEVLDHTRNLGIFMDNVKRHLKPDGVLVVTMHNPQAFEFLFEQWFFKGRLRIREHNHWQNINTMEVLVGQSGLEVRKREFYHYGAFSKIGKVYDFITWPLPMVFSRCVLYIVGHAIPTIDELVKHGFSKDHTTGVLASVNKGLDEARLGKVSPVDMEEPVK